MVSIGKHLTDITATTRGLNASRVASSPIHKRGSTLDSPIHPSGTVAISTSWCGSISGLL